MSKVKSVIPAGIIAGKGKRVVTADSGQRIAPRTHDVKGSKVCIANTDMPNMYETKGKVVKVLY